MELQHVPLGRTGTQVSDAALGTWRFGHETAANEVEIRHDRALELLDVYADAGGTFIDTADTYGNGRAGECRVRTHYLPVEGYDADSQNRDVSTG